MTSIQSTRPRPLLQIPEANMLRERGNTLRSAQHSPKITDAPRKNRHMSIPLKENTPRSPLFTARNLEHFEPPVRPSQQSMKTDLQSTQSDVRTKINMTDSFDALPQGQVAKQLRLAGSFSEVCRIFISLAAKSKMSINQTTDHSVTVKKGSGGGSCHCLLRIWQSANSDQAIYQLLRNKGQNQIKLILVEGAQAHFEAFCSKFMREASEKGLVRLGISQTAELFIEEHGSQAVQKIRREVEKIKKNPRKASSKDDAERLLQKIKILHSKLLNRLATLSPQKKNSHLSAPNFSTLLESQLYSLTGLPSLYHALYTEESRLYQKNRTNLLTRLPLTAILSHLQLKDHLAHFTRKRQQLKKQGVHHALGQLPYLPALRCLQTMHWSDTPSQLLQKVILFQEKINFCHGEYFGSRKLGGMDDYLPISIYCVLAADCSQRGLLGAVKMLQSWLSQEEDFEEERKIVTNLQAGLEYVWREWKE